MPYRLVIVDDAGDGVVNGEGMTTRKSSCKSDNNDASNEDDNPGNDNNRVE